MKVTFTSRGIKYHVVDRLTFCDLYFPSHNTTDEYILECLEAEMNEYNPNTVIWKKFGDDYYFYINPESVTAQDLTNASLDSLESEAGDITFREAYEWAEQLMDNFVYTLIEKQADGQVQEM